MGRIRLTIDRPAVALRRDERYCQRGRAGQSQKNVRGGEKTHYRNRDKKNGLLVRVQSESCGTKWDKDREGEEKSD